MATKIQIRRDTLSNWNLYDPILSSGEIAFVTDENKFKVGNGSSTFTELPYLQADAYIDSVILGTDTTGNYVETLISGDGIDLIGQGTESASVQITNSGVLSLIGTENQIEVSASTGGIQLNLPSSINVDTTGNAATATSLQTARTINLGGDLSGSASFNGTSDITITATVDSESSVNSIVGTENEVDVSASAGDVVISLPETINANTTGSAASLTTARTIALSGDVSGSATFDGSASVDIVATIQPDSVALGTDTTGDYVARLSASGEGLSLTGSGESASVTISNTGVTSLSGTENEIDISASTGSVTLSLPNIINANTTGSAATLTNSRVIALSGDVSGSVTFDGSASVDVATSIQPNSVALGTDTTGNYVATASAGTGISVSGSGSENSDITISNTGVTSLTGTASQISVSASNGDSTLSLPSAVVFPGTVTLNTDPTQALHAVTKQYVDEVAEGLITKPAVEIATTENLTATYNNGTDGVGATLTATSNGAFPEIDGITLTSTTPGSNGILVKNQSNPAHNGRYNLTQVGDGSSPWILTRCGFCDESNEIPGMYLFVKGGTLGEGTGWVAVVDDPENFVIGTGDINFIQFSGAGTYTAGIGLDLNGTEFSNTGVLSLAGTQNEIEVSASSGNITVSLPSTINANTTGSAASLTTPRAILLGGDLSGSASFNGTSDITITAEVVDDSHNHIISNIDGLQTALNDKAPISSPTFTGTVTAATLDLTTAATATAATSYWVETGSDGVVRPKTLANVRTEIVTNAAVNAAAATTVGTVTSGTWAATDIGLAHGGTNASLTAANGAVVYSTSSALALTGVGTAGQVLTSNGAGAPTWETPSGGGGGTGLESASATITANDTDTTIVSFSASANSSAEMFVQQKQGTKMTTSKFLVMWDGTDVNITEFAIMDAAAGAANTTITASHSGGTISVTASSPDAATTNVIIKATVNYIAA